MSKTYITWSEVSEYIDKVEEFVHSQNVSLSGVYGLPRGGCILAVMLSHRLGVPYLAAPHSECLIVDDIADSGRSLIHYTENDTQKNKYIITTMFFDERSAVVPDFWFSKKNKRWIVFPWENIDRE